MAREIIGIILILISLLIIGFWIWCAIDSYRFKKGWSEIEIYPFDMEFITMDNIAHIHHSYMWCMKGYNLHWWGDSVRNDYFVSDGVTYPKHFVKSVKVVYDYTKIKISNKLLTVDSHTGLTYLDDCKLSYLNEQIGKGMIEVLHWGKAWDKILEKGVVD